MASTLTNNLYPPVVDTYAPAFLRDDGCKLNFSLSSYNDITEIQGIQVMVKSQKTGKSELNKSLYPGRVAGFKITSTGSTDNGRVLLLTKDIIQPWKSVVDSITYTEYFKPNEYYSVQMRFVSSKANERAIGYVDSTYTTGLTESELISYQQYYSEWSTVCLIRAIDQPLFDFTNITFNSSKIYMTSTNSVPIVGRMYFEDSDEAETLDYYNIEMHDENGEVVFTSPTQYTNKTSSPNEINYTITYNFDFEEEVTTIYTIYLTYTTINGYSNSLSVSVGAIANILAEPNIAPTVIMDRINGSILIYSEETNHTKILPKYTGAYTIIRTSNKSNFKVWEDIYTGYSYDLDNEGLLFTDRTVENGVWYRYGIQARNDKKARSHIVYATVLAADYNQSVLAKDIDYYGDVLYQLVEDGIISEEESQYYLLCEFDDVFLTELDGVTQLKIAYDKQITNVSHNITESKIETLASKYPYIIRTSEKDYVSCNLSGIITALMDEDNTFLTNEELYNISNNNYVYNTLLVKPDKFYDTYSTFYNIQDDYNYIKERIFRDKVIELLYKEDSILLRSPTEGNILVRLMDIGLNPKTELNNLIYDFSCSAIEVAEFDRSMLTLNQFDLDTDYAKITGTKYLLGQISIAASSPEDIYNLIKEQHKEIVIKKDIKNNNYYVKKLITGLRWISVEFQKTPTSIYEDSVLSGPSITLNQHQLYLGNKGYIELDCSDLEKISSIFLNPTTETRDDGEVLITYIAEYINAEVGLDYKYYVQDSTVFQLTGEDFNINHSLYAKDPFTPHFLGYISEAIKAKLKQKRDSSGAEVTLLKIDAVDIEYESQNTDIDIRQNAQESKKYTYNFSNYDMKTPKMVNKTEHLYFVNNEDTPIYDINIDQSNTQLLTDILINCYVTYKEVEYNAF